MKQAYVFPGQGSQFSGMAKDLYETDTAARARLEKANDILGFRITDIMFDGTDEDLRRTDVTQPAVFLHSTVLALSAIEHGIVQRPDMVAGHSLGEFSALCVAGAIDFEDALVLVSKRARAMQSCCEKTPGTMAAVIGCDPVVLEDTCRKVSAGGSGIVIPANYNNFTQTVISGTAASVQAVCEAVKGTGKVRAVVLQVGGAFHSPLMEPARIELASAIEATSFKSASCPVYQNVTALASTDPDVLKKNLLAQLTSPVRWTDSVSNMISDGAVRFTEIGPGKALRGMISKIAATLLKEVEVGGMSSLSPEQQNQ
ncbi:MAG: ACP S-malonyltransferase [Bacteroidales bacterium]|nr:ACP S-malonyltransferase [Bacteroidales bacterium]